MKRLLLVAALSAVTAHCSDTTPPAEPTDVASVPDIVAPATTAIDATTTTVEATTTTTAAPVAPEGSLCPQWFAAALAAGWPESDWQRIDYVMWRESRCTPSVHTVANRDDSYGLVQLNMKAHRRWVGPLVGGDFTQLLDPATNLAVARQLFNMAQTTYGCGWQPWQTRKTRWCK